MERLDFIEEVPPRSDVPLKESNTQIIVSLAPKKYGTCSCVECRSQRMVRFTSGRGRHGDVAKECDTSLNRAPDLLGADCYGSAYVSGSKRQDLDRPLCTSYVMLADSGN